MGDEAKWMESDIELVDEEALQILNRLIKESLEKGFTVKANLKQELTKIETRSGFNEYIEGSKRKIEITIDDGR